MSNEWPIKERWVGSCYLPVSYSGQNRIAHQRGPEKHRSVMPVTEGRLPIPAWSDWKREAVMKKIFLVLALAFAFTTGMTVVTVVAHTDQAMADCGGSAC